MKPESRVSRLMQTLSLRSRYATGLGIIAMLALVQYVALSKAILDERQIGSVLDYAGRQRMLSQRIPLLAMLLRDERDPIARSNRRAELLDVTDQLERLQTQLTNPNSAVNPVGWPPPMVRHIYFDPPAQVDDEVHQLVDHVRVYAGSHGEVVAHDDRLLQTIVGAEERMLGGFDRVIAAYVVDAQDRQKHLLLAESAAFIASLAALVAVLFVFFRPVERQIEAQRTALVQENDALAAVVIGARSVVESLSGESLLERFVLGAQGILGSAVLTIDDGSGLHVEDPLATQLETLRSGHRAIVRESIRTSGLTRTTDGRAVALTVSLPPEGGRLTLFSENETSFAASDLIALELFSQFLTLAANNSTLFRNLQEREARVADLDRLKSDLIAMLAHDFRSPLTTIIGYADLLREGFITGDEIGAAAQTIASAAWRLSNLATDTLTMAQLERSEITLEANKVDLMEVVGDSARALAPSGRVSIATSRNPLPIICDGRRMRQVVDNLIGNALKYSGEEPIFVELTAHDDTIAIAVTDRGIGIPAGELAGVFERFHRATNAKRAGIKGTGFGLYISRLIVELHGGKISVESSEGTGSTFTIVLPIMQPLGIDRDGEPDLALGDGLGAQSLTEVRAEPGIVV